MEATKKQRERVTVERILQTKGFEHYTNEEAQNLIDTYRMLAKMTYELFTKIPEHEQKRFIRSI